MSIVKSVFMEIRKISQSISLFTRKNWHWSLEGRLNNFFWKKRNARITKYRKLNNFLLINNLLVLTKFQAKKKHPPNRENNIVLYLLKLIEITELEFLANILGYFTLSHLSYHVIGLWNRKHFILIKTFSCYRINAFEAFI